MPDNSEPFDLAPIERVDVFRSILTQLETLITTRDAGDRLGSERELAERLRVSRVSVREALRALEGMGKVEIRRNSGIFVADQPPHILDVRPPHAKMDAAYFQDIARVRAAIECEVIRAVAQRTDADLRAARIALEGPATDDEPAADANLNVRFEVALGRESGNPVLAEFQRAVHTLWLQAWLQRGGGIGPRQRLHREHRQILAALEAHDTDEALRLMTSHINPYDEQLQEDDRAAAIAEPVDDVDAESARSMSDSSGGCPNGARRDSPS